MADLRLDTCPEKASYTSVACTRLGPRPALVATSGNVNGHWKYSAQVKGGSGNLQELCIPKEAETATPTPAPPAAEPPPDGICFQISCYLKLGSPSSAMSASRLWVWVPCLGGHWDMHRKFAFALSCSSALFLREKLLDVF